MQNASKDCTSNEGCKGYSGSFKGFAEFVLLPKMQDESESVFSVGRLQLLGLQLAEERLYMTCLTSLIHVVS